MLLKNYKGPQTKGVLVIILNKAKINSLELIKNADSKLESQANPPVSSLGK